MERVKGIEPSYAAWEAAVLPLNYTRFVKTEGKFMRAISIWQCLFVNFRFKIGSTVPVRQRVGQSLCGWFGRWL